MAIQSVKAVTAPEPNEPITLQRAAESIEHDSRQWAVARHPTYSEWAGISRRLAAAERALAGLNGVNSILRNHHFASEAAGACEASYIGITDFEAGCLVDAQEVLTSLAYDELASIREVVSGEVCHER